MHEMLNRIFRCDLFCHFFYQQVCVIYLEIQHCMRRVKNSMFAAIIRETLERLQYLFCPDGYQR
jgi:hypothetical protein